MAKRNIFKNRGKTYIFSNKGGGGESGITVTPLTVTENGTYTSAAGQAYSPVTVRVEGDIEVEDNKSVSISENGTVVINPSTGKDAMAKVTATVNVESADIEENKSATIDVSTYNTPVEVTPSAGKDGMAKATITLSNIPVAQGAKLYAYTENIYDPDNPEYYGRSLFATDDIDTSVTGSGTASLVISDTSIDGVVIPEANVPYTIYANGTIRFEGETVDIYVYRTPELDVIVDSGELEIEANKAVTIDASSYSAPVEVVPTSPNDAMAKTTVTLTNIPSGSGGILYAWYSDGLSEARYTTFNTAPASLSSDNKIYKFDVETSGDPFVNGLEEETVSDYVKTSDNEFTCTLDGTSRTFHKSTSSYEGEDIIISNEIDIEANKAATIDVSQYSTPVEITPTAGKDGMSKTTVTLTNIPTESDIETEKTVSITQNGTYTINPTTGKDAMAKVTATVSVATATVEGTNLILSSGSVSGNTLNL